jgi:hypothetical protein
MTKNSKKKSKKQPKSPKPLSKHAENKIRKEQRLKWLQARIDPIKDYGSLLKKYEPAWWQKHVEKQDSSTVIHAETPYWWIKQEDKENSATVIDKNDDGGGFDDLGVDNNAIDNDDNDGETPPGTITALEAHQQEEANEQKAIQRAAEDKKWNGKNDAEKQKRIEAAQRNEQWWGKIIGEVEREYKAYTLELRDSTNVKDIGRVSCTCEPGSCKEKSVEFVCIKSGYVQIDLCESDEAALVIF